MECALGGIARSVPRLALALAQAGERVTLVAAEATEPTFTVAGLPGVEVKVGRTSSEVRQLLLETINQRGDEVVLHHSGVWTPLNHFAARIGRERGVPVICSPRSMLDPWALRHKFFKKRLAYWLYARRDLRDAACLHATAELEAENITALGLEVPIRIVPNGIDVPTRRKQQPANKGLRRLLFLSRLHPKKGVEDLIRAFARLSPKNWELVIAGNDDGGYRATLEKLLRKIHPAPRIFLADAVSDAAKWDLYQSADVFVLPSYSENFGLVVGEALACGRPVITTRATPWHELEEEQCGWWIAPGEDELLSALKHALSLPRAELDEMGERGRQLIERRYGWASVAQQMMTVYREVREGRRR